MSADRACRRSLARSTGKRGWWDQRTEDSESGGGTARKGNKVRGAARPKIGGHTKVVQGLQEVAALAMAAHKAMPTTPRWMARKPLLLAGPAGDIMKRNSVGGGPWVTFSLLHSIFSLGRDF